jgi:hypothetical protein
MIAPMTRMSRRLTMLGVAAALVIHLLPIETAAGPLDFQEEG